jgi:hypothetical protein
LHHRVQAATWTELFSWIHDRFSRDQHDLLLRQLFHIKQSGPVQDYNDRLTTLVDQLIAYGRYEADHRYFTTCFIDGLRDDIKSIVLVQRPTDLDTTSTLALLQEMADSVRRRDIRRPDYMFKPKLIAGASPLPLPPPPKMDKNVPQPSVVPQSAIDAPVPSNSDSKVAALCTYRRARGLYQYYAEKYL